LKPIVFHPGSKQELASAVAYYEGIRSTLRVRFQKAVELSCTLIQRQPKLFPQYKQSNFRKCIVKRFPFNIFFMELDSAIWVAAVAHHKRRPDYWIHRQPEE
jgi:toxin ParE1/3/4